MRTSEIRQRWLNYFAANQHKVYPSVPLVSPDPSILFTIAGMVPFIPYIIGTEKAPDKRVTSVQKCIRTNDIEEVGKTTRHGTFFQMCGNFSFGDYFKEGAISYAWDLLTGDLKDGKFGLDPKRLWVTIWENDDVAEAFFLNTIGLDPVHLQKLPREESFWDTGQPGPAGPTAELHYDRGPEYGPEGGPVADTQGDRYVEIWNLVFDQYLRGEGKGSDYPLLGELDKKCIDTGLGLERLACLLQNRKNIYEIDEIYPVITAAEQMSGKRYGKDETDDIRMRVVADHVRSALMLISDGVRPGNEGRGYVLRRLVRRAVRSMKLLGVDEPTLPVLLPVSKEVMAASYPELEENWQQISEIAYAEEEAFRRTLNAGTTILETAVSKVKKQAEGGATAQLSGSDIFALHDTYGFPVDLTLEMAAEHGVAVDEKGFRQLMQEQKDRARADAMSKKTGHVDSRIYHDIQTKLGGSVDFLGYTETMVQTKVAGILHDGIAVPLATAPSDVEIILESTPFYAESGGQLADRGTIRTAGGGLVEIDDVQAPIKGLSVHRGRLVEGEIGLDENAFAAIDTTRRTAIARAHTATHMVHKTLHEILGDTATQAGSENSPSRMRFDFRYGKAVSADDMNVIEERVNSQLAEDLDISEKTMPVDEALASGAMSLFGEKYGKTVRVVSIGDDWSRELCAGTHVPTTGRIGRVALLGESSIGSGVRRIDALVGDGAYEFHAKEHALVSQLTNLVGSRADELPMRIESLVSKLRAAEKQLSKIEEERMLTSASGIVSRARVISGIRCVLHVFEEVPQANMLRTIAMRMRELLGDEGPAVAVVVGSINDRPNIVVATNAAARDKGIRAGELVKYATQILGGGGGGKDDLAQGGGSSREKIPEAMRFLGTKIEQLGDN